MAAANHYRDFTPDNGQQPHAHRLAAQAFGVPERHTIIRKWMLRALGLFNGVVRESYEMLYQSDRPYIFDSSKFERAFSMVPTSYETAIAQTALWYRAGLDAPVAAPSPGL